MISDTPSPPQPSRTVWMSKPCPPCWDTTTLALPCAPTPTPPGRSRTRPPRPWAASWGKSYKGERQQKTGREGRSSRPVVFWPNASPAQRVAFGNGGTVKGASFARQGEASDLELVPTWVTVWVRIFDPHCKTTFCNKKSPKTEVFEDF